MRQVRIVDVQRLGTAVVHYATAAVAEGSAVEVKLDWQRRFDHMQVHTGEASV